MNPAILTSFLALFAVSSQAASIPINRLVDGIQKLLIAPEETGLRLKRSPVGEWDKELDLDFVGVVFQIKYHDPAHPYRGGHAHVKFPGRRFFHNAPFDNVDLDILFNNGNTHDALFDMKVHYKFEQKFVFMADLLQEGSFEIYRKLEGGQWKTKIALDNNNKEPRPFFEVSLESDHATNVHAIFVLEDIRYELKMESVTGESITIGLNINGVHYTGRVAFDIGRKKLSIMANNDFNQNWILDFFLNPAGNWGLKVTGDVFGKVDAKFLMTSDFKKGEISAKYQNKSLFFIQLIGQAEVTEHSDLPYLSFESFDYVIKYNVAGVDIQADKAKVKYDGKTAAKKFELDFTTTAGQNINYVCELDFTAGLKYLSDLKLNGNSVEVATGEFNWTNDAEKFELDSTETFDQTPENPFYSFNTQFMFGGRQVTKGEKVRKVFFDKHLINRFSSPSSSSSNQFKFEEKFVYDGNTWYDIQFDTTIHKSFFKINTEAWGVEGSTQYTDNGGLKMDFKLIHGDQPVHEEEWVYDVKTNDENKFDLEYVEKVTMTEESPLYEVYFNWAGRYFKAGERHITVFMDKQEMSVLIPMMTLTLEDTADGQIIHKFEFDNTKDVKMLNVYWGSDIFSKDYNYAHTWQIRPDLGGFEQDVRLMRGGESTFHYLCHASWHSGEDKVEMEVLENVEQTEDSPFYDWGPFLVGHYHKEVEATTKFMYDKQNRNFLLGQILFEATAILDGERFSDIKLDTTSSPYTLVWYQPTSGDISPSVKQLTGQDEVSISVLHTPGTELLVETNLPQVETFRVTTEDSTRKVELNGKEWITVDYTPGSHTVSQTVELPNGERVIVSLSWPSLELHTADLEFAVEVTPDFQVEGKMGWECSDDHDNMKVYIDAKGSHPFIGDYMVQRNGEYEKISDEQYKLTWIGKAAFTEGPLAPFSPIDTDIVASFDTASLNADVNVVKSFGGKRWGFTLANDKFILISGRS